MIHPNTIILSAGKSSRMGRDKALLPLKNKTFVEIITQTFACFSNHIYLVVSPKLKVKILERKLKLPNTTIIVNTAPEQGRMSSVLLGLGNNGLNPVFLHNVDIPLIKHSTLEKLILNYSEHQTIIPSYQNIKGHPILLGTKITEKLINQDITTNLKLFIRQHPHKIVEVDDYGIIQNINTRDDYIKLINTNIK